MNKNRQPQASKTLMVKLKSKKPMQHKNRQSSLEQLRIKWHLNQTLKPTSLQQMAKIKKPKNQLKLRQLLPRPSPMLKKLPNKRHQQQSNRMKISPPLTSDIHNFDQFELIKQVEQEISSEQASI